MRASLKLRCWAERIVDMRSESSVSHAAVGLVFALATSNERLVHRPPCLVILFWLKRGPRTLHTETRTLSTSYLVGDIIFLGQVPSTVRPDPSMKTVMHGCLVGTLRTAAHQGAMAPFLSALFCVHLLLAPNSYARTSSRLARQ
jgi:hypothetical protein